MNSNMLRIFYWFLVVICVSLSAYISHLGFAREFGIFSIVFAVIVAIILFSADIFISNVTIKKQSIFGGILFLFFGILFSFVSNFNFFYTNAMREDVTTLTIEEAFNQYRSNLYRGIKRINNSLGFKNYSELKRKVESEISQLNAQVYDPNNIGVGSKSQRHIDAINELLEHSLTNLKKPPNEPRALKLWIDAYIENVQTTLKQRYGYGLVKHQSLIDQMKDSIKELRELHKTITLDDKGYEENRLELLKMLSDRSMRFESEVNLLLESKEKVKFEKINIFFGRLGEIVYSLENGFLVHPNILQTTLSAFLSIVVDIIPLLYARILLSGNMGKGDMPRIPLFRRRIKSGYIQGNHR